MAINTSTSTSSSAIRWAVIAAIAGIALFASYRFAVARSASPARSAALGITAPAGGGIVTPASAGGAGSASAGGSGCACCGGGSAAPAAPVTGAAKVDGGVQKISVDLSKGYYDPNQIELKAGVPAEITFGQSSGCTGAVQSADLNFYEDLTAGPVTVKLPALQPGSYTFTCGMQMVSGTIVVK